MIICSELIPVVERNTDIALIVILSAYFITFLIYLAIKVLFNKFYKDLFNSFYRIEVQGSSFFSESNTGQQQARVWVQIASTISITTALMTILIYSPWTTNLVFSNPIVLWFLCLSFVIVFIYSKWVVYRFVAWLFDLNNTINTYINTIMNIVKVLGLIIFPVFILIPLLHETIANILSVSVLTMFALASLYIMWLFFSYSIKIKFLNYYAILYFCTLEILPILFLIKFLWAN